MHTVRTFATIAVMGLLAPLVGTAAASQHVDEPVDITAHDLTIDYRPDEDVLRGTALITAKALAGLTDLTLHLDGPVVSAVTVDGVPARSFTHEAGDLIIAPATRIPRGRLFRVRVDYAGHPGGGWLRTESGGATAFQGSSNAWFPVGARQDQADFHLTATAPEAGTSSRSARSGRGRGRTRSAGPNKPWHRPTSPCPSTASPSSDPRSPTAFQW
ncbi:hypothetical protein OG205_10695 [Lentzea sp. NBC_00516]|uniref:hypothetical protein n=1 Tax=Lentzea sp. NBC_00516 TaxID=2903582 RepID=UPI002E8158AF|nr:hypothetical protein [Lentzea sp. NBC_00516]WUD27431.1 hypothetical protein OG205_10695 [Lentzea sp. NBC_00516]